MFATAKKLRSAGVLGLNERNADFILRLNPRSLYPRVDDKLLTKKLAIAAGMADGLGFGHNSVAAAVTRGLAEMARLTEACGGRSDTLMGLSGLGDLVLTCTGNLSRNRRFGMAIAQGKSLNTAKAEIGQVVEGVRTAMAVDHLAGKLAIELPLMQSVHRILTGELNIQDALAQLMSRPEKPE